jgi:SAM-dependent methyltransferase
VWDDPELYDLENADDPEFDVGFWSGLLSRLRPGRVLELACGTGRLTAPLARAGSSIDPSFALVGLDSSAPFLSVARDRVSGLPVTLVEGDMRAPAVEGPFDLVMVPFNSLAYLVMPEDRAAALRAARSLVANDGHFAFDLLCPRYDLLAEACVSPPLVRMDADHAAPEVHVERFLRWSIDTYDPSTQTPRSTNRYKIHRADGRAEHRIGDVHWHICFPAELELLLSAVGLRVVERFGDWDSTPWDASSRRMLWVCEAA